MRSRSFSIAPFAGSCAAGGVRGSAGCSALHGSMEALCGPGWQRSERLPGALRGMTETEQNISELLCFASSTKMMTWHLRLFQAICGVLFSFFFFFLPLFPMSAKVLLTCLQCHVIPAQSLG